MANKQRHPNILIHPDLQSPFHHIDTIPFLKAVKKEFRTTEDRNVGDFWDFRYLCRHGIWLDPDLIATPTDEYLAALEFTKKYLSEFPRIKICHSNHGARIFKRAKESYIPNFLLKSYKEVLKLPKTVEVRRFFVEHGGKVVIEHGNRSSNGVNAALKLAISNRISTVIGHHSAAGGILYNSTMKPTKHDETVREQLFGMNVGGMIDEKSYGMAWAKDFTNRITLGCGVLMWDNKKKMTIPHFIPYD